jgi:ribonuclease E
MSKKMLINASHPEENRVAIVVDGILSELDIELAGQQQTRGNIYKAVVVRVEPGLQAAFVDYGSEKHGFLQLGEIHPQLYPATKTGKDRPRINDILHRGQEILVQVVKGERGTKGAALTTLLSLPGRYMVLMPDSDTKGVSRKILDEKERKTLKKTMAQLDLPSEMGYIVRTAGIGKEESELKRDFNYLVSLYKGILARRDKVKAPAQLYQESDIVIRSIRDYFSSDIDEVLIDDEKVYQQARDFFALVMPELLGLVKLHREKRPIFSRYQIEEQIEALAHNQVPLPSGGSIVIDQTEALVAIDVNSGRMAGEKGIEATAARSNIEAAAEIGRQLRLRDLGGLIVIDFIDMRDQKKVREVEVTLRDSIQDDKARITLGKISQFGLLELSRQRIRPTLSVGAYLECPHCHGRGKIKSPEAQAVALLRQLHATVSKGQIGRITAQVPLDVANYLHNEHRRTLSELEQRFDLKIEISASAQALPGGMELEQHKREKTRQPEPDEAPISHAIGMEEALAAISEQTESHAEPQSAPVDNLAVVTTSDAAPEAVEAVQLSAAETAVGSESVSSKRRRRRKRRRTERSDATPATAPAPENAEPETLQGESQPEVESVAAPELPPSPAATRPTRRGRRRTAAQKAAQTPAGGTQAHGEPLKDGALPASAAGELPQSEPESAAKPQRRTRRSPAKKASATKVEEPAATKAPELASPQPETETTPVATPEKPKRSRRSPAKKASATKTEEPATAKAPEQVNPDPETEVKPVATPEKPKRSRRSPAKKASATKVEEPATAKAPDQASPDSEAEAKPVATPEKPKRSRRTPAKKTTTDIKPESPVAGEKPPADKAASTTSAAKPSRRSPRKPTRKVADKASDTPPEKTAPSTDEATAEAKPKPARRPRKTAVKVKTETVAQSRED